MRHTMRHTMTGTMTGPRALPVPGHAPGSPLGHVPVLSPAGPGALPQAARAGAGRGHAAGSRAAG